MNETEMMRASAWATFVAAQLGFSHHPGTTRDGAKARGVEQICVEADAYLREYDKRFGDRQHHKKQENGHAAVSQ